MPKTVNEEILDAVLRHQIYLLRYSGYVRNRVNALLDRSENDLELAMRKKLEPLLGGMRTMQQWKRMQALLAAIDAIRLGAWENARKFLLDEMEQLAYAEPINLQVTYTTPLPVQVETVLPANNLLKAIALSRPFEGRILKDWAKTMADADIRRINNAIQAGMVSGEDMGTIVRRVLGTGRLRGTDGIVELTRRQVTSVVRTAVQHVANGARDAFFDSNKDLLQEEQFVATLDSRTTPICRALDGKRFRVGKGPRPPLHFQCRSVRVAAINGAFLGSRPAKPTTERLLVGEYADREGLGRVGDRESLPRGSKRDYDDFARKRIRELVGPVPATETYQTWLKKQSVAFQEEVLGKEKAKLFRNGGLTLDKFVDLNSGREFTLKELAAKHKEAFVAAGLDPSGL
jgi:SPP1 gp7 family putative phage head morphogenesis protein